MALSSLSANTDFAYESRLPPRGRRTPQGLAGELEAKGVVKPVELGAGDDARGRPFDATYYASRFKADLSDLRGFADDHEGPLSADAPRAGYTASDNALFDFFGNLNVLLVSVRSGDLERARAAADALEMEVMVERSAAGSRAEPGKPSMLDDLRHLLIAGQSRNEAFSAIEPPPISDPGALEPHPTPASAADATGAAYETLMAYIDGEVQSAA
jgi:hypothetical protein